MFKLSQLISVLFVFVFLFSNPLVAAETSDRLAEAQKKLEEAAREYAELSSELGGDAAKSIIQSFSFSNDENKTPKARLGINIGKKVEKRIENGVVTESESGANVDGVAVHGVSPDSPAEKAGLKAGDVITALNGQTLQNSKERSAIKHLTDIMQKVEPGETVDVMYQRDGVVQSVSVITDEMPKHGMRMMFGDKHFKFGGPDGDFDFDIESFEGLEDLKDMDVFKDMGEAFGGAKFIFLNTSPLGDAEIVELSPELGEYFGTDEGLLVVKAPSNSDTGLRDGDVIRQIDGRIPTSVRHAMRIFRSYEPGETVNLEILRKKRKRTLSVTIPEREKSGLKHWNFGSTTDSESDLPYRIKKKVKVINGQEST